MGLGGGVLCVSLFVCLSDCPHALIGRQPSRGFALFLYVEGAREGGQQITATAQQPRAVGIAAGHLNFRGQYEITRNTN